MEYWKTKKILTHKDEYKYLKDFTQEELIFEKVKCATDSIHVIETYFRIFDQTRNNNKGEIVPFILFPFQKNLIRSYEENRFNITNKYRQAGISTITCAWLAVYIAFNSNRSVAIVANKLETARDELMKDVTDFIDMLPPFLHPKIADKNSATHKKYANNSQVKAFATNSLRGYTPTFLFWDEAAWCENGETFWTGTLPTLSTGGHAALVSCVTENTSVWSKKGLGTVGDFVDKTKKKGYISNEYDILGKDDFRKGSLLYNNGFKSTRIINNEYTNIECTLNHKLWVYSNLSGTVDFTETWKIRKDDLLSIQFGLRKFGDIDTIKYIPTKYKGFDYYDYKINKEFIEIVSIFLLKGKILNKSISAKAEYQLHNIVFENLNPEQFKKIKNFMLNMCSRKNGLFFLKKEKNIRITNPKIVNLFHNTGLYFDQKYDNIINRNLPDILKGLKEEYIIHLLKMWIYYYDDKTKHNKFFKIKHKSIVLLKQFQEILINYGILAKIKNKSIFDKNYTLEVLINYNKFIATEIIVPEYNQHLPMGIIEKINKIISKYEIELPFNNYDKLYLLGFLEKIDDIITKEDKFELDKYISKNIFWTKVLSIKSNKNYTYDFSLYNNKDDFWEHSVIYNSILGHQTPNGLDPVFYKTFDKAKTGEGEFKANELQWYYDPRYSKNIEWRKKVKDGDDIIIKETNIKNFEKLVRDGFKPWSPWYEAMASKFNYDKKKIAQELECVVGDTIITIRNNETGLIENIKIEELYERFGGLLNTDKYSILNHNGKFVDFLDIIKKQVSNTIKIKCDNNYTLETSKKHLLITKKDEVLVENLKINDEILTKTGFKKIIDIKTINKKKDVYDVVNVGKDSLYLTNGIVSHNCSFLGSGNNFIDEKDIKRIEDTQVKDPIRLEYEDFFWIWEDPVKDGSYVMTIDVSTGAGDDYSTIIILKQHESHLEEVAEFKHKVSPDTLGVIANDYGKRYNNAYAIVDITGGIGAMTVKAMLDLGYDNIHYSICRHEPTKEKLNEYVKEDDNGKVLVPGFVISTSNRGIILTEMKRAIETNEIEIKSNRLTSEFKTFITTKNNRIADHRRSFNDDLIIALAMAIYVFSYDIKSVGMSVERTKKMLDAITNNITDNNTGNSKTNDNIYNINPSNPYVANNWLFKGLKK